MDYSAILTKFQTCMEDIGVALRKVSGTSQKYKFTEIASSIRNLNKIIYVGTISSGKLDISSVLPNKYADLTVDNFLLVPTKITTSVKVRQAAYGEYHTTSNSATINKTYDAATGILKASGYSVSVSDSTVEASASASVGGIKVYVVEGDIVDATS